MRSTFMNAFMTERGRNTNRIYTIDIFELKSKMFDCAVTMLENEDITNDAVRDKLETLSEINGIIGDINKGMHSRKEHSKSE